MADSNITIVTAFFPLGREEWSNLPCSNSKYLANFAFWAAIRNDLIVYTHSSLESEVIRIRKQFGRDNTTVICVDDFRQVDLKVFEALKSSMANKWSLAFKRSPKSPESWSPEYNMVMYLKWWCLDDAARKMTSAGKNGDAVLAWVDFGYNHGGKYYSDPSDFDFLWTCPEFERKIHIYNRLPLDDIPLFEVCRSMNSYIIGGFAMVPVEQCSVLLEEMRKSILSLCELGLADDDQILLLMTFRRRPELFKLQMMDWFQGFELESGRQFRTKPVQKPSHTRLHIWWKKRTRAIAWSFRWMKLLSKEYYDDLEG